MGHEDVDMSRVAAELGLHAERVADPAQIVDSLKRAKAANDAGQPAYIEYICSQYPVYGGWVPSPIAH
jgi:thiamine pyrophosphate-dependent acetolactate synthase large subunit-like protein